jgi:hypothetical protein
MSVAVTQTIGSIVNDLLYAALNKLKNMEKMGR